MNWLNWRAQLHRIMSAAQRLSLGLIDTIPPVDLTATRLEITKLRIVMYWRAHGKLPACLGDLPALPNRDNAIDDAWGHLLQYRITPPAFVTLESMGAEGSGHDARLSLRFAADEPDCDGPMLMR